MRALMISIFAIAALIVVPLAGGTAASASIIGRDQGFGTTVAAAEQNAKMYLLDDYAGCVPPFYYYNIGQNSSGTWYAWVDATCEYIR